MSAVVIQPIRDNIQMIGLLDNGSSCSSTKEECQKQQILDYLGKTTTTTTATTTSNISSYRQSKRVPRLGQFLLLKTLGVGEFGKVKMAKHFETGQTVAVKLVKKENIDSSSQLEKIRMEIEILKILNHPYIVKLLSVNETQTCIGMVLEYAQGGELFEYIYRQRYLKEHEARRLFSQLISSVYYMHQKNIVHRDLKLENILLDCNGNLIVTDFGFANQFTEITGDLMSTSCGSPVYAAPELVMTGRLYAGKGVDIWSCGIILYAMLSGYLPFDDDIKNPNGDNIGRLYRYIMSNTPNYPSHLSSQSKDLIGNMLIPDPSNRCTLEQIMQHPWLLPYRDQISKSVEQLELEAQEIKNHLLKSIESTTSEEEEVCCDDDDIQSSSSSSSSSSNASSSSYSFPPSYNNTKNKSTTTKEVVTVTIEHPDPPTTPIPCSKENTLSTTIEEFSIAKEEVLLSESSSSTQQQQSTSKSTNTTPFTLPVTQSTINKPKRHTMSTVPETTTTTSVVVQPMTTTNNNSLKSKLLSTVRRRQPSLNRRHPNNTNKEQENHKHSRHSWQHVIHRSTSPSSTPPSSNGGEQSKSLRIMSWIKNKSLSSHGQPKMSRSTTTDATIPIATVIKETEETNRVSIESELRLHTGDMNRSALTSKPATEVLVEITKILLLLGIEVNQEGYKLECVRNSTEAIKSVFTSSNNTKIMNDLATRHHEPPLLNQPIYGHPTIDHGQRIEFIIEICRFQNLSGLFSVDIQLVNDHDVDNYTAYQFIGQKILGLLQMTNVIRNTNFNVMLSK